MPYTDEEKELYEMLGTGYEKGKKELDRQFWSAEFKQ